MEFPRPEYWSGLPFPSPVNLPDPGIKPASPTLQADSLMLSHQGSPFSSIDKSKSTPELSCYKDREIGLPWWLSGKESACQGRRLKRCRFDPWVWKILCRRKWPPTSVFLPGKFHGQRSLVGYRPRVTKSWTYLSD